MADSCLRIAAPTEGNDVTEFLGVVSDLRLGWFVLAIWVAFHYGLNPRIRRYAPVFFALSASMGFSAMSYQVPEMPYVRLINGLLQLAWVPVLTYTAIVVRRNARERRTLHREIITQEHSLSPSVHRLLDEDR